MQGNVIPEGLVCALTNDANSSLLFTYLGLSYLGLKRMGRVKILKKIRISIELLSEKAMDYGTI